MVVENFIRSGGMSARHLFEFQREIDTRFVHGDLHSRNLLIDPASHELVAIDYANSAQDHVVKDFAKLEIDSIYSVLDAEGGTETSWVSMNRWQRVLASYGPDATLEQKMDIENESLASAIAGIRDACHQTSPRVSIDEYLMASLFFTLRVLAYPDIALPKKGLAVQCAGAIVNSLEARLAASAGN